MGGRIVGAMLGTGTLGTRLSSGDASEDSARHMLRQEKREARDAHKGGASRRPSTRREGARAYAARLRWLMPPTKM